jgi:hypothetical protein
VEDANTCIVKATKGLFYMGLTDDSEDLLPGVKQKFIGTEEEAAQMGREKKKRAVLKGKLPMPLTKSRKNFKQYFQISFVDSGPPFNERNAFRRHVH